MNTLQEFYIDFICSSFGKIEMTKLSKLTGKSHDVFTKQLLLNDILDDERRLWSKIKPILREYENEENGCIVIDDMFIAKPNSKVNNEVICWHYDHVSQKMKKGLLMLNFLYTDERGVSVPLGYEFITKTEEVWNDKYQKNIKKSKFTKNEIMRDKLEILNNHNKVKYKYILFDKWFASIDNMVFIEENLKKKFICPIKKNRKVALSKKDKIEGKYVNISSIDIEGGSSRLIYLQGYEKPLKIIKQVVKNGNDGESIYLYLTTNDIDLSFFKILEIYKRRWKIEEYHKSLKQNLHIGHSPTKVETSQRNHIFLSVCSFIKLEKLRINYKTNHFAIKEKIYIEALKTAFQKFKELEMKLTSA